MSLCNACGIHYAWMKSREKIIPPNPNPQKIPITSLLNDSPQESEKN